MYVNYINNKQQLEFSCIKDINAIKQLKSTLKNPVTWIIRKEERILYSRIFKTI